MHAVTRALVTLAPAQRTILDLAYVQDWSVSAIAAHLGCSVSIGNGPHEKRHADSRLGGFPRDVRKAALRMDEIVLHIHDKQC